MLFPSSDRAASWYQYHPNKSPCSPCSYIRVDIPSLDILCLLYYSAEKSFRLITASLLFAVAQRYGLIAAVVSFVLRLGIIVRLSAVMRSTKKKGWSYLRDCVYKALILMATDNLADGAVSVKVVAVVLTSLEGAAYMVLFMLYGKSFVALLNLVNLSYIVVILNIVHDMTCNI